MARLAASALSARKTSLICRVRLATLLALLGLPLAGCGGGSAEDDVRAAWNAASEAVAAGSATDFCGMVSAEGKDVITDRTGMTCEDAIRLLASRLSAEDKTRIEDAVIEQVDVSGDEATVRYESNAALAGIGFTGRTSMVRVDGRWLLRGI